jgi:hypothetical protein
MTVTNTLAYYGPELIPGVKVMSDAGAKYQLM